MNNERAVGYSRLSQGGKSLEAQREAIEGYCREHGLDLVDVYNDGRYSSGYDAGREEYQSMLERLQEDGDVEHVVVRDRSRLARDSKERLRLFLDLDERDVEVHIAETGEKVDLDDPYSLTRESAQADADDVEKRKEAERGKAEARRRQEQGLPNGRPPRGLRYSEDKTRLVPGENFGEVLDVIEARRDGLSWREIEEEIGVNYATARRIWERRKEYLDLVDDVEAV